MADVSVRAARSADAGEIGRIQVATWSSAYGPFLPPAALAGLTPELAAAAWQDAVDHPPSPAHHVLVALEQQRPVGFAAFAPAAAAPGDLPDGEPDEDGDAATTVQLDPLLVEPRWGRRGHGSRLLAAAIDHARADGMTRGVVWLPEQDEVSRRFFASAGWAPDGLVRVLDTGSGELRQVRLHTDLG
jgi:GNAT superfamily N-acetyltransferase